MSKQIFLALVMLLLGDGLWAQTSGTLTGRIRDPQGGAIPGALVVTREQSTNTVTTTVTNDVGVYVIPKLSSGLYTLRAEVPGFKVAVAQDVQVDAGLSTTQDLSLELGEISDSVVVQAAQGQIERQMAQVSSLVEGQQITDLPFTSRNALDLALTQSGTSSPGAPSTSTVGGLRRGALNIEIDGIRVQDNFSRSDNGFTPYIRPSIDGIEEFSLTQAGQTAESAGESPMRIRFVTKKGTNEWHGGAWWYHRNTALNANYYFNNLGGVERQRQLLNQVGVKVGGPVIKDKFFFFFTLDSFRLPEALTTASTAFADEAAQGIFTYNRTDGGTNSVDLLALAAANGFESTMDPVNGGLINQVSAAIAGLPRDNPLNPYTQRVRFNNPNNQERYFPTLRLDYNINDNWRWEGIWRYQYLTQERSRAPNFPGFELFGSNTSHRFVLSTALRTAIGATKTNEFRVGTTGGNVGSLPELLPGEYPAITIGGQPNNYYPNFPLVTDPLVTCCGSRRNYPQWTFTDNFSWTRGDHTFTFGAQYSKYDLWIEDYGTTDRGALPYVSFGVADTDPVNSIFNTDNFPGADSNILSTAGSLYATLTGRILESRNDVFATESTQEFVVGGPEVARMRQHAFGLYVQDSWRLRPEITLNWGLRYQLETPHKDLIDRYSGVGGSRGLLGPSKGLFQPGELSGNTTQFNLRTGHAYPQDTNNFAPNLGIAWNPTFSDGVLRSIFGRTPVFRGGYSIAYIQEGLRSGRNVQLRNEGYFGNADLFNDVHFPAGSVLARNGLPPIPLNPGKPFDFPIAGNSSWRSFRAGEFADNLSSSYVQSWSVGIQRELSPSTVMELRYVGNKGTKLWMHYDWRRESNMAENGFLAEFIAAQNNLALSLANGGGRNFSNQGFAGQVDLPIFATAFGSPASSQFRSGTNIARLNEGLAGEMASSLGNSLSRHNNLLAAGYPINFWFVNPHLLTLRFQDNGGYSTYNAFQVELRRRMSEGLLLQANYTWSHALTNLQNINVDSAVFALPRTLRDVNFGSGNSPFNIYHSFKANWIWELPFGSGRRWASSSALLNKVIGGWSLAGILRAQSGSPFVIGSGFRKGTLNGDDGGVIYNVDRKDLQSSMGIRRTAGGRVYWVPEGYIASNGRANPAVLTANTTPGTLGDFSFFEGPSFLRTDLTVAKRTDIGEGKNVEFRAELLNAFNNINFLFARSATTTRFPQPTTSSSSFGRVTQAFRDPATTNDLGGRMVQLVLRLNF